MREREKIGKERESKTRRRGKEWMPGRRAERGRRKRRGRSLEGERMKNEEELEKNDAYIDNRGRKWSKFWRTVKGTGKRKG